MYTAAPSTYKRGGASVRVCADRVKSLDTVIAFLTLFNTYYIQKEKLMLNSRILEHHYLVLEFSILVACLYFMQLRYSVLET